MSLHLLIKLLLILSYFLINVNSLLNLHCIEAPIHKISSTISLFPVKWDRTIKFTITNDNVHKLSASNDNNIVITYQDKKRSIISDIIMKYHHISTTARNTFISSWNDMKIHPWKYLSIPVASALIGYITNYIGVKMLFYPVVWRGKAAAA